MDSVPNTNTQKTCPLKKRKTLEVGYLTLTEKQSIVNMYEEIVSSKPEMKKSAVVLKITDAMGVARSTVYKVLKEYKDTGAITSPKHLGGRPAIVTNIDEHTKNYIRQLIHRFFVKNEVPTLNKILNEMKRNPEVPNMSRSSLYKLIKHINFIELKVIEELNEAKWKEQNEKGKKQNVED